MHDSCWRRNSRSTPQHDCRVSVGLTISVPSASYGVEAKKGTHLHLALDPFLVATARAGDREAIDSVLRICWPHAFRVAYGILGDRGLAEDAAQEASALIATRITALRHEKAFCAWFYRLVTRSAVSIARRQKRTVPLHYAALAGRSTDFDRTDLLDAVSRLPISQRSPLILTYYIGLKSSEIANILSISESLVRFRLMLARRALRIQLRDRNTPCKGTVPNV